MKQNTLNSQEIKDNIKFILSNHRGRANAITNSALADMIGIHERSAQLLIRKLITEGIPITSSTYFPAGYFIVETWKEVEEYAGSIKGRLIEDAIRRRDFRRSAALYLKPASQGKLL